MNILKKSHKSLANINPKRPKVDQPYTFQDKGIPVEALEQGTYWYDKFGKRYEISQMNRKHAFYAARKLWSQHGPGSASSPLAQALYNRASSPNK